MNIMGYKSKLDYSRMWYLHVHLRTNCNENKNIHRGHYIDVWLMFIRA